MLPVIDVRGEVAGFTSRILPGEEGAKYLNTPETIAFKKGRLIYALNFAKSTKRPNLVLVEGNIDVITLHQAGFDNVVATMGTALTEEHARILARYTKELVLCYDNDAAGKQSTDRVLNILKKRQPERPGAPAPQRLRRGGQAHQAGSGRLCEEIRPGGL